VTSGLAVPAGDPAQLDALAAQLRELGTQTGDLGANTLKTAASVLADSDWTGQGASSFADFAADLGGGVGSAEPALYTIANAAHEVSGAPSAAQNDVAAYNSIAQAAQNDPSGLLLGDADLAGQKATASLQTLAGTQDQAAATISSAAGDLGNLFKGPVASWVSGQHIPQEGIFDNPGDPLPPGFGGIEIYPLPTDIGDGNIIDPVPTDIGGGNIIDPVPEIGGGNIIDPIPPEIGASEGYPIGQLGPLINFTKKSGSGGESGGQAGQPGDVGPVKKPPKGSYGKTEVPSWVINDGNGPYQGETPTQTATRIMDAQYGKGNYPKGPNSEYSKIVKWAGRHF
jgi:hypothetical protein